MSASKDVRASPFSGKGASFIHLQRWLMMLGKTKAALQYLFWKADEGVLNLDDCTAGAHAWPAWPFMCSCCSSPV